MKKPSRFLRLVGVAGLLATLLAGAFSTSMVYAGEPDPDPGDDGGIGDIWDGTDPLLLIDEGGIYFPWVGNDDESTGLGPADTSVSVMNIDDEPAVAFAFVGTGGEVLPDTGSWDVVGPFFLSPWASKTFTAADLGIAEGGGAPVAFAGYNLLASVDICEFALGLPIAAGNDVNNNGECTDVEVYVGNENDDPTDPNLCFVDDSLGNPTNNYQGVFDGPGGLNNDGDCTDAEAGDDPDVVYDSTVLGGYAKQAVDGETLPYTTAADSSVSGYNSIGGFELVEFDDWYFPIIQTNGGPGGPWNSILRIANFGQEVDDEIGNVGAAAVTVSFFPYDDGQGSLDTGFQLQFLVNTGETIHIDISDYVPEGAVMTAHVYSDSAIFAMVDRVKVGYSAWITNTASNAPHTVDSNITGALGQYVLFAPDVRTDFFGWNTGINVANLVNDDNNVNIQYFNLFGNAPTAATVRLAPQGGAYFYDPAQAPQDNSQQDPTADVNADVIGSALIWSDYPVAAVVDATKYPESTTELDPNVFQAMSYSATANVYTQQAFPLVQKGNPTTGQGATSGINIMNPNSTAAQATVWWVNPSGFGADNFGTSAVAIPGFANGFLYTGNARNLPNGFFGSAVLASTLPVVAVTTQVDYQVEWDGTAVWLAYNPCGFYRDNAGFALTGDFDFEFCYLGDPFNTQGGSVEKSVHDELGNPITGAYVELYNEAYYQHYILGNEAYVGIDWYAWGYSDVDGEVLWTNVPVGTYYVVVLDVPINLDPDIINDEDEFFPPYMYGPVGEIEGPYTLIEGEDLNIENVLDRVLPEKYVYLSDEAAGVPVCLVEAEDFDDVFDPVEDTEAVECQFADANGDVWFEGFEPGWYFITVNYGFDGYPAVGGFTPEWFGPEFFALGGVYENDLDIDADEGNIQKVVIVPEEFCDLGQNGGVGLEGVGPTCEGVSISGDITIFGPDGFEVTGSVSSEYVGGIGPEDQPGFALTDFNVPVGGPYTIEIELTISVDTDGDPLTPPAEYTFTEVITETELDGQVICDDAFDPSSTCAAVVEPDEDEDGLPEIFVYEEQTTRVFNDLTEIVTGQMDVFVRDEVTDEWLPGALVCVFDVDNLPYTGSFFTSCDITDADGQAEFFDVPAGIYSITAAAANYEVQGSGQVLYLPFFDALFGNSGPDGPFDDELGDELFGLNLDFELALDPSGTVLDIQTTIADVGVNNVQVNLFLAALPLGTDAAAGFCTSGTLVASELTTNQAVGDDADDALINGSQGPTEDGIAEFHVDPDVVYCAAADPNADFIVDFFFDIDADVNPQCGLVNGGNLDFDEFDRADDIDIVFAEGGLGIIDIQYFVDSGAGPVATNGVDLFFFQADLGDVPGALGTCAGLLVGIDTTGDEVVNPGAVLTPGIASLSVDTSLAYCVSNSIIPGGGTVVTNIVLDPADQDDDIDGTLTQVIIIG